MSATPARDYSQSQPERIPFRPDGEVIPLARRRPSPYPRPEIRSPNVDQPTQTEPPVSGPNSGTRITLGDIPGEWDSIRAVWSGQPEPLSGLLARATAARQADADPATIALACWAAIVLIPRGLCHLASWILAHPARSLAIAIAAIVVYATC